jgi:hypothetical protein
MLIWLNGPFGVGKTTVARRLVGMRGDFRLFDPEQIGFMLRSVWPKSEVPDFQDLPLWRELTLSALAAVAKESTRTIVVPMTLGNPDYFREIVGGLRVAGVDVRHFTLMAPAATIRRRNWLRLTGLGSKGWALARIEPCLASLAAPVFATHVEAGNRSPSAIAGDILAAVSSGSPKAAVSGATAGRLSP